MPVDAWPEELPHGFVRFEPFGGGRGLGSALAAPPAVGASTYGPIVRGRLTNLPIADRARLLAARALQSRLAGGASPVMLPVCVSGLTPQLPGAAALEAAIGADAAAGEDELVILLAGGYRPLRGGEWFSIDHDDADVGRRAYLIVEMVDNADPAEVTVRIVPKLRGAIAFEAVVDFITPTAPMRLVDGFELPTRHGRFSGVEAVFEEWFEASPAVTPSGLTALGLSPDVVASGSAADILVGYISGNSTASVITLTDTAGGRFKVVEDSPDVWAVYTDAVATDYGVATAHTITARETLGSAFRDSDLEISVSTSVGSILWTLELVNPGFELGSLTGWTSTNAFAAVVTSGSADAFAAQAGTYMGSMGKALTATLSQSFTLPDSLWALIDGGHVYIADFAAYHRRYSAQDDHGALYIRFSDGSAQELARACSDPATTAGAWAAVSIADYPVPVGTRVIQVGAIGVRIAGDDLDSYWDAFANPTLRQSGQIVEPVNYEMAFTPANWTNDVAVVSAATSIIGTAATTWNAAANGECHRDESLPSDWNATIDAGDAELLISVLQNSAQMTRDSGRYSVQFLDGTNTPIGVATYSSGAAFVALPVGTQEVLDLAVPATARKVRVTLIGVRALLGADLVTGFNRVFVAIKRDA